MTRMLTVPHDHLATIVVAILEGCGMSAADATAQSDALLSADLRGTASHGLIRLPFLVRRLRDGGADPAARPIVATETPATAVMDGQRALGAVTSARAMMLAIEKARNVGAGVVAVRNSDFFGTCAHPAMMALPHDMIGIVWTNGFPGMAAWGGAGNAIGNNPIGFAIPTAGAAPIVLDMAFSVSAGGRVRLAAERGETIPDNWIVDRDGNRTTDPNDLAAGGTLLSLGHKGFGLAVMGEILAGVLPGAGILTDIPAWFRETSEPVRSGHLHIALDIAAFGDPAAFKERIGEMAGRLKAGRLLPGVAEILMPGERAWREEQRQRRDGLALLATTGEAIVALCRDVNLSEALFAPLVHALSDGNSR